MRQTASWWVAGIGLAVIAVTPWTEAKSSSQTIGVQIIMPPRPAASPTPLDEAWQELPAAAKGPASASAAVLQRMTTVVHDGDSTTVLVTDIPVI